MGPPYTLANTTSALRKALARLERRYPEPARVHGTTRDTLVARGWAIRSDRFALTLTDAGLRFIRDHIDNAT